ncbi:MAG: IMP cyclohydrolase [Deltaproteobacteria bacterium]|jgi:phosphoribosylaminoimidazolecarboxamide formyltransferase/IMP cyclohydrolase|nr:IMP cyclohydrolase [Deltaproteobacteria bacterium]
MLFIKQALLSVSDKTGLVDLAIFMQNMGTSLISTGGTAKALMEVGLNVTEVSDYTGSPELLDGRVKSLHPKIHAGLLYRRDDPAHQKQMAKLGWSAIDMVVVNLYPFEKVVAQAGTTMAQALENIDIGGPCLLRAAAKNHPHVAVLSDPSDYPLIVKEMTENQGAISPGCLKGLAQKAFARTSAYDAAIRDYLASQSLRLVP